MSRRSDPPVAATAAEKAKTARQARLATALRANLRRRKAPVTVASASTDADPETQAED